MKQKSTIVIAAMIVAMIFGSCSSSEKLKKESYKGMKDLRVPSDFSWSLFAEYELTIDADVSGLMQVLSDKGVVFHKAHLTGKESYSVNLTIPAAEKGIRILFDEKDVFLNLSSHSLYYTFESSSNPDDHRPGNKAGVSI